jgi:hypothetical protein
MTMFAALVMIAASLPGPLGLPDSDRSVQVIRATGVGHPTPGLPPSQAKLMARRAAEVRAVRALAAKLGYHHRATIRGFRYVSTTYRPDDTVEVVVEYPSRVRQGDARPGVHARSIPENPPRP